MNEFTKALLSENHYAKDMRRHRMYEHNKEIAETVSIYPDFNFEKELENEEFKRLISIGVAVKNAYEVIHIDEILMK